jgi:hypothetical protein
MFTWSPCWCCSSAAAVRSVKSAEEKQPGAGVPVPSGVFYLIVSNPFPRRHFTRSNTHEIAPHPASFSTFSSSCREETSTVTRPQEREIDQVRVRLAEPGDMKKAMELSMETFYGLPSIDLGMSPLALFMEYRNPRGGLGKRPPSPSFPLSFSTQAHPPILCTTPQAQKPTSESELFFTIIGNTTEAAAEGKRERESEREQVVERGRRRGIGIYIYREV